MTIQKRDMTDTGYAPESFDLVFCEHAFFLLDKPDAALAEFMRVLKKGGWLVVSVHNRYVQALARAYTPDEFRALLESNGFHVEKIVGKGLSMPIRVSKDLFTKTSYSEELLGKILEFEFALCERQDALAGHMQAIARKP